MTAKEPYDYRRTTEGTVVKQEPRELSMANLNEMLNELLADERTWASRQAHEELELMTIWNPYEEQLSDTRFRWLAYERGV